MKVKEAITNVEIDNMVGEIMRKYRIRDVQSDLTTAISGFFNGYRNFDIAYSDANEFKLEAQFLFERGIPVIRARVRGYIPTFNDNNADAYDLKSEDTVDYSIGYNGYSATQANINSFQNTYTKNGHNLKAMYAMNEFKNILWEEFKDIRFEFEGLLLIYY